MKFSKKLLSLFLALIMLVSALSIVATAYTIGSAVDTSINYKYSVAKVSEAPMEDGSAVYTGDDIYAVSIYGKAQYGLDYTTTPVHYNKNHFSPMMLYDGTDLYVASDTYYTDMGEATCYMYTLGDFMNNTGMYKADGSKATTKALAKVIGLGNKNAAAVSVTAEAIGTDYTAMSKYLNGLPNGTGVMYVNLDDKSIDKNAYMNVIDGVKISTDWVKLVTVYFQRNPGVTDADCVGDVFGVVTPDCFTVDGTLDEGGPAWSKTTVKQLNPEKNVAGNAVVGPKVIKTSAQVKMTATSVDDVTDYKFRVISSISDADWQMYFANTGNKAAENNAIIEAGFVAYKGTTGFCYETAMAVAQDSASDADYTKATTSYIQKTDGSDAKFAARIELQSAPFDATYIAYVKYLNDAGVATYAFYDFEGKALLQTNFESIVNDYINGGYAA